MEIYLQIIKFAINRAASNIYLYCESDNNSADNLSATNLLWKQNNPYNFQSNSIASIFFAKLSFKFLIWINKTAFLRFLWLIFSACLVFIKFS